MERGTGVSGGRGIRLLGAGGSNSAGGAKTIKRHVVTCFLTRRGRILILKRSGRVGTFRGRWAGVSGYIEPGEMPLERAFKEIREETGLLEESVRLVRGGGRLVVRSGSADAAGAKSGKSGRAWPGLKQPQGVVFIVHPFLFELKRGRVRLDWEHTELRWVRPSELRRFRTVPGLAEALESVWR
ncbi:MAG: NUDIX pyrophosphatase [Thermoplasmata archaeon]